MSTLVNGLDAREMFECRDIEGWRRREGRRGGRHERTSEVCWVDAYFWIMAKGGRGSERGRELSDNDHAV